MRQVGSLAVIGCLLVSPTVRAAVYDRTPSQLRIQVNQSLIGTAGTETWHLVDAEGQDCGSGVVNPANGIIQVDPIASNDDIVLTVTGADGKILEQGNIPARKNLSPLIKTQGTATIYQVPVRTYFASDMGKDHSGKLNDFTVDVLRELKDFGADYVWLTGVLAPATADNTDSAVVKGDAGSYFAVYDNWNVNPQIASASGRGLDELDALINRAHSVGLKVLIDLVVNHTARVAKTQVACKAAMAFGKGDNQGAFFSRDNNYFYIQGTTFQPPQRHVSGGFSSPLIESPAKVTGNNITSPTPTTDDWFDTVKLNYGYNFTNGQTDYSARPKTWNQMADVARYWLEKGVDGFRIDIAHAVPMQFYQFLVPELRRIQPQVFLLAEAYEKDTSVEVPGFSYEALFDAGIDSIYNSEFYDSLKYQAAQPGHMYDARLAGSAALRPYMVQNGYAFTNYLENHDEVRIGSWHFAKLIGDRKVRAEMGLALSAFAALMPANFLMQGGQEVQEDASVMGGFSGDSGKTSIFDFVYQSETRRWLQGESSADVLAFRDRYKRLLQLKHLPAFAAPHSTQTKTYLDLHEANWTSSQSYWVASYLRFYQGEAYLVVVNSDPFKSHDATIHFTYTEGQDSIGALAAAGIEMNNTRYRFTDVFAHEGWQPRDPNVPGDGFPGWVLYHQTGIPSGLYLGAVPPATTYVLKIERI